MSTEHQASTNANNEPIPSSLLEADQAHLRHLLETQKYAVLATDNHGQPYTSLMAYSITDDLRAFILMTERGRLKYENLRSNPRVAIMIDNRENLGSDLNATIAVTSLGIAEEISSAGTLSVAASRLAVIRRIAQLRVYSHPGHFLCDRAAVSGRERMAPVRATRLTF